MSDQSLTLVFDFLQKHPEPAARILEQHDIQAVVRLITELPPFYVAAVFKRMLPHYTARLCKLMHETKAADCLGTLNPSSIAAILRYLSKPQRRKILRQLPQRTQSACQLLLKFSQNTVGAWMRPQVITIAHDFDVNEALNVIGQADEFIHADYVFVVDRSRSFKGRIHFSRLLRAERGQPVQMLVEPSCRTLTGHMSVQQTAEHSDWGSVDVMPVLNRNSQFIGVLRHVDLRKGLEHLNGKISRYPGQDPLTGIFDVYGHSLLVLFRSMSDIVESDLHS